MGKRQVKDFEWIREHYAELHRKYPDMFIAVSAGKVLVSGKKFGVVYDRARKLVGDNNFAIECLVTDGVLGQAYLEILRSAIQR